MSALLPRVLHIFSTFAPAGPELRAVELMAGLGGDYSHTIVAMDDCLDAADRIDKTVQTRTLAGPGTKNTLSVLRWTWELLAREQPDLLLTYNWGAFDAVLAARLKRFPHHIHHEDGFNIDEADGELPRRRFMRRVCLPRVQHLIVPSTRLEQLARTSWKVPAQRLSLIPNGVDTDRFTPDSSGEAVRTELHIPSTALIIGTVAGYRRVKRLDRLIRAAAALEADPEGREIHLILAGDGPERASLETLCQEHSPPGGKVHLLGFRQDLRGLYGAFDVFALTSASEQQPIALLEAMASGLPAVCTDVGDVGVTLGPNAATGLVDARAPDLTSSLKRALSNFLKDPSLRQSVGQQNRARVQKSYGRTAMIARYGKVYGE